MANEKQTGRQGAARKDSTPAKPGKAAAAEAASASTGKKPVTKAPEKPEKPETKQTAAKTAAKPAAPAKSADGTKLPPKAGKNTKPEQKPAKAAASGAKAGTAAAKPAEKTGKAAAQKGAGAKAADKKAEDKKTANKKAASAKAGREAADTAAESGQPRLMRRLLMLTAAVMVVAMVMVGAMLVLRKSTPIDAPLGGQGLYINNKLVQNPGAVVSFGKYEVPFGVYHYFFMYNLQNGYGGRDGILARDTDGTLNNSLKQTTLNSLRYYYAWISIGDKRDIGLTDEDNARIEQEITNFFAKSSLSREQTLIANHFLNEQALRDVITLQLHAERVASSILKEDFGEAYLAYAYENFLHIKQIFIPFASDGSTTEADAQLAEALQLLEEGVAFNVVMGQYNKDSDQPTDGYLQNRTGLAPELVEAADSIGFGEVAQPVRSQYGYHIVTKMEISEEYIFENPDVFMSTEIRQAMADKSNDAATVLTISYGRYYNDISYNTMR